MSTLANVRVVRSNGDVETDWMLVRDNGDRVLLARGDELKNPSKALFDHWQIGGMARSTKELNES